MMEEIKDLYKGEYVRCTIMKNDHDQNVLFVAIKEGTFESDEGNLEWDTVIALYAKDGVEPQRFEFTPLPNNVSLFTMLAK